MLLRNVVVVGVALFAAATYKPGDAADFPIKPIRYVVPSAPGGNADILARLVADRLTKVFGQQVVVDNRPGASNIVGTEFVVKSAPDGHTLLQIANAHFTNPSLVKQLPYDTLRDLAPVALLASTPLVLVVHPSLPVKSAKDLVALAKARPGELNYHTVGPGTSGHLAGALLSYMAGINIVPVAYRGTAQAMTDVFSGDLHFAFPSLTSGLQFVKSGRLRVVAVTSPKRSSLAPELPTIAESGVAGYQASIWNGLMAPAATPPAVVERLNAAVVSILSAPDVRSQFANAGSDVAPSSPAEFAAFTRAEIDRWAVVIKAAGIRSE